MAFHAWQIASTIIQNFSDLIYIQNIAQVYRILRGIKELRRIYHGIILLVSGCTDYDTIWLFSMTYSTSNLLNLYSSPSFYAFFKSLLYFSYSDWAYSILYRVFKSESGSVRSKFYLNRYEKVVYSFSKSISNCCNSGLLQSQNL